MEVTRLLIRIAVALGVALPAMAQVNVANPHGKLALPCQNCHTTTSWSPLRPRLEFNHNTDTHFQLRGMHQNVACNSCHVSKIFTEAGTRCADCHADFHKRQFGAQCESCHTVLGWRVNTRPIQDHWNRFPLLGAHAALSCDSCHTGAAVGQYVGLSTQCISCHTRDFQQNGVLNHVAAGFPTTCETCHTVDRWQTTRFDHTRYANFALTGSHQTLACNACHAGNRFQGVPTDCASCHLSDFTKTTNPNHVAAGFPHDCATCHNTATWLGATFNHNLTAFPLTGAHITVTCLQCHTGGNYTNISTDCVSCHLKDYQSTAAPNHAAASFPQNCQLCHTTTDWTSATFNHNTTRFPLTGAHATTTCAQCHSSGQYATLSTACSSCHLKDYQGTTNPNHAAAGFPQDCSQCHSTVDWNGAMFNHTTQTTFPLTGKHTTTACLQCHSNGVYKGLSTACNSCHLKDYQTTNNPSHVAAGFPQDCSLCHTTTDWNGATFNHTTQTKFPLTGAHITATCAQCHSSGVYAGLNMACSSCHAKDYQTATNPNHVAAGFPQDCQICHTTTAWTPASFNHNNTKFPLTGAHTTVTCLQCHTNGQYATLNTACNSCHLASYQATKSPNHVAAGFPQDCQLCHNTTAWTPASFNHTTQTTFPLTGAHTTATCLQCHSSGVYKGLATTCNSCHLANYQATKSPNHIAAGFPQDCQLCHTTTAWTPASFNHTTQTTFPLTGAHTPLTCLQCHSSGVYKGLATTCNSCHLANYQATKNPNHIAAGFPQDCQLCHTTTAWTPASFNHTTQTTFPLTGAHTTVTCVQCHSSGVYKGLATACNSCHLANYQATKNPNHIAAGFPQDCQLCHNTTAWVPSTFNHSATKFPLTGKHATTTCAQCHSSGQYATLSTACNSCHLKDYQGTTNPNHAAAAFPQDCSLCHTTVDWTGAKFDHTAQTTFPLTGKHITTTCLQCHTSGVYKGLSTACNSCHLKDYQGTTNPNHAAAGFPQDCQLCHTTTDWTGATFNHTTQTTFPLTGKHTTTTCAQCHSSGVYKGLSTACNSCHLKEYQATTNPNHAAASFPQDCSLCHSTTDWLSATFDHSKTKFPLTGKHTTATCAQCHSSGQYATLSTACYSCHSTEYNTATNPNHAALGYPQDCSQCHSTTDWLSATFNHTTVGFNLAGKHATTQCLSCHVGGKFPGTPTDCYSCHTADYNSTTNPNHVAAGFPKTCLTCHLSTIVDWTGATFNHTYFPMTHGNANSVCATCHTNSNDYSVFSCTGCHLKPATDSNHSGVRNYVYNSTNCYSCHPKGTGG